MALTKGKHIVEEINGVRCSIVEKGATKERMEFIKNLLEFNKLEVSIALAEDQTYTVGVSDIVFNIIIAIYNQSLHTPQGLIVSPAYWRQTTTEASSDYWNVKK
jgi:hypothetical protein